MRWDKANAFNRIFNLNKMKKFFLAATIIILTTVVLNSCTKHANEAITEEQAVQNLVASGNFIGFTGHFIADFSALMQYHRSGDVLANKTGFLSQVKLAGSNEAALSGTYQSFSLNYETAIALKNKIDNDLLQLLNQNRFLLRFSEQQVHRIIVNAIDAGIHSNDEKWLDAKRNFRFEMGRGLNNQGIGTNGLRTIGANRMAVAELTLDEVWGCVKSALGFGATGILGIAGMTKLAEQGIQQVVITASKWIAERVGWFGVAITLIDFGMCVYNEAKD